MPHASPSQLPSSPSRRLQPRPRDAVRRGGRRAKPSDCALEFLDKAPGRPVRRLGELEAHLTAPPPGGAREALHADACRLGADAVIVTRDFVTNEFGHAWWPGRPSGTAARRRPSPRRHRRPPRPRASDHATRRGGPRRPKANVERPPPFGSGRGGALSPSPRPSPPAGGAGMATCRSRARTPSGAGGMRTGFTSFRTCTRSTSR